MSSILENAAVRQAALPVSVEQYHRLGAAGIISEATELLQGVIVEKTITSPNHSWLVQFLAKWLQSNLDEGVHVRQEQPLTFVDSEPEPDLAVVSGNPDDYREAHPTTADVVIEVAISSEGVDREKASLYSAAGVSEYVIVLPNSQAVEKFSQPSLSGYREKHELTNSETPTLKCLPNASIRLAELFS